MKANEIQIGDWVSANGASVQVTSLSVLGGDVICVMNPFMPHDVAYASNKVALANGARNIDELKPIPLTEEILEKNGFERAPQISDVEPFDVDEDGNKHYSYNKTFWGWFQPDNIFCISANGMRWLYIKYVHQLQQALRLCGVNKEIVL